MALDPGAPTPSVRTGHPADASSARPKGTPLPMFPTQGSVVHAANAVSAVSSSFSASSFSASTFSALDYLPVLVVAVVLAALAVALVASVRRKDAE